VSCGSIRELREEQAKDDQYEALTGHQLMVLDALVTSSVNERKALSVGDLSELIHEKPSKSQKVMMSKTVKRLESLGFCIDAGSRSSASGPATITYLSTPWAVSKHQITL
jgi:D-alanine-D-alanine ligase-like ATP-grasp enzyme